MTILSLYGNKKTHQSCTAKSELCRRRLKAFGLFVVYGPMQWPVPICGKSYASEMTLCIELAGDHNVAYLRQRFPELDAICQIGVTA